MTTDCKRDLMGLVDYAAGRLRKRLAGLTDEEYFWEPAPGCWSVRRGADGVYRRDRSDMPPDPPPLTTIAWRMAHVIEVCAQPRVPLQLRLDPTTAPEMKLRELYGSAAGSIHAFEEAHAYFQRCLEEVDDNILRDKLGPAAGIYADDDVLAWIIHLADEFIHHAAEVGTMRDLYRAFQPRHPLVDALLAGDSDAVEAHRSEIAAARKQHPDAVVLAAQSRSIAAVQLAIELGFDINAMTSRSAAHYAAGVGDVEMLKVLVDAGADLGLCDPEFDSTPLGWAQWFRQPDAETYLQGVGA